MKVNEIFHSIQGESSWAGYPCVFVRLTGCNLRCTYCDTRYAYDEGEELSIADIVLRVAKYQCHMVEITGGEPLLQAETPLLVNSLLDSGYCVLLETNGSIDVSHIDERCNRIIDVKLPSSGEADNNYLSNINNLQSNDELKFVVATAADYESAKRIMRLVPQELVDKIVINFSCVFGALAVDELASWILRDHLAVRLNLQLHKFIWPPERRAV